MIRPTTGPHSHKPYKCRKCGHEFTAGTNHWGAIYNSCPQCHWRAHQSVADCMELPPETHDLPPEWVEIQLPMSYIGEGGAGE